jgi:hypothetical protein
LADVSYSFSREAKADNRTKHVRKSSFLILGPGLLGMPPLHQICGDCGQLERYAHGRSVGEVDIRHIPVVFAIGPVANA